MVKIALVAAGLVAGTVAVHSVGTGLLMSRLVRHSDRLPTRPWPTIRLLTEVAWLLLIIHAIEIALWGLLYRWMGCLPDAETAFYFSGVTYTTIGYGDLVLPKPWRMLGPIEGVTGILMCGLSAGLFFATVTRIYAPRLEAPPADRE